MTRTEYETMIEENLENVLESAFLPELGELKKGKVRDIYFQEDRAVLVTTDRISAFDFILSRCIPFKGAVLTGISEHNMKIARNIIPTAVIDVPDANIMVQKKMKNIGVECVVRKYLWGSMADSFEKGEREFCGIKLGEDLIRYQSLEEAMYTPTTKAEEGHDLPISFEDTVRLLGEDMARRVMEKSISLFNRFSKEAEELGLILIDTKYEFGVDEVGELHLIDEVNTPDSSRFCEREEWKRKFSAIRAKMKTGNFESVTHLLREESELKIEELSKQFVRDALLEKGGGKVNELPDLNDRQVIETSLKYIRLYERFVGRKFDFSLAKNPKKRIMENLRAGGYIYGGCVQLMAASPRDQRFCERFAKSLEDNKIPYVGPFYASAHKETHKVLEYIRKLDNSIEPVVIITSAGRSNGLGPVVAGNSRFPVISCNPYSDNEAYMADVHSSLRMPSKLPLAVIIDPGNAVLFAKRILDIGGS